MAKQVATPAPEWRKLCESVIFSVCVYHCAPWSLDCKDRWRDDFQSILGSGFSRLITMRLTPYLQKQSSFLEQTDYLRLLWMFVRESSIKEFANNFWSSSPNANNASNAWQLNFNNGNDNNNNRNNSNRVRLVRPGV